MDTVTVHRDTKERERLSVIIIRTREAQQSTREAPPDRDGYFSLSVPLSSNSLQIGVLFGINYRWVQIESTHLMETQALSERAELLHTSDIWPHVVFDQMNHKGGKLFECLSQSGLLIFVPPPKLRDNNLVLHIVFRPVVKNDRYAESK
jgi:hypothetical protein